MNCFDCQRDRLGPQHAPGNLWWLAGQMFLIPVRTFLYGMGMMVEAMRGMQVIGDRGIEVMTGGVVAEPAVAPALDSWNISEKVNPTNEAVKSGIEETKQMDQDLNDDMLKLVRYKILFVKRDHEFAFPEQEELVSDNMNGQAYTAWKIAEFIQKLHKCRPEKEHQDNECEGEKFRIPAKWREQQYPKAEYRYGDGGQYFWGIDEDDKKYLRVFYEVLERYPREKFKFEEDQIKVLKEIRDRIPTGGKSDSAQKGMNVG